MYSALSISGSDPTGGSGIQADMQTFALREVRGAAVVSALTVQDSSRIHNVLPVFPSVVIDQIRAVLSDWMPDVIKIGMLASDDVARAVLLGLTSVGENMPRVVDPLLVASDGRVLLERRAWPTLNELIRGCSLVTPTRSEAEQLSGLECNDKLQCERVAQFFLEDLGAEAVLIHGGCLSEPTADLLAVARAPTHDFIWLVDERPNSGSVPAGRCVFSSAVAAGLAHGWPLQESVRDARALTEKTRSNSSNIHAEKDSPNRPRGAT